MRSRFLTTALCFGALTSACTAEAPSASAELETTSQNVVYGVDDRTEFYAHPNQALRDITEQAIVAMVSRRSIEIDGEQASARASSLGRDYGLCEGEAFYDQPSLASCSGTLIDDDLVLTAGHCVEDGCDDVYWVFNYFYESEGELRDIVAADVFGCQRVVVESTPGWGDDPDYAIVQLDRIATPRFEPVPMNASEWPVSVGDSVSMIGFGSGLPAKIDDGGAVIDERRNARTYFTATTDAFGGNSGSGVFNTDNEVVGILVAGEQDYEYSAGCGRVSVLPEGGGRQGGESVTYSVLALEELCDSGWPSQRLCAIEATCGDGICSLGESYDDCPDDCDAEATGEWTCDPSYFAARDGCDCDCGAYDPDCDDPEQELFNCRAEQFCNGAGACQDEETVDREVPAEWACGDALYATGDGCDCECGTYDPDCDNPSQDIFNCLEGEVCGDDGFCLDPTGGTPDAGVDVSEGSGDTGVGFGDGFVTGDSCASAGRGPVPVWALGVFALLVGRRRRA